MFYHKYNAMGKEKSNIKSIIRQYTIALYSHSKIKSVK